MMPFRLPLHLTGLTTFSVDSSRDDVAAYVAWLEAELQIAKLKLQQLTREGEEPNE